MIVRFEEDEYIAVAILMQETGYRQWKQWMRFFLSGRRYEAADFTTIQKLYYLSDEGYEELQKW